MLLAQDGLKVKTPAGSLSRLNQQSLANNKTALNMGSKIGTRPK
jgi:hypothetical protein